MNQEPLSVRLMMTWMPFAGVEELDTANSWQLAFRNAGLGDVPLCLWSPSAPDHPIMQAACWHHLELPKGIDRYVRGPVALGAWTPWGNKSGPNFQFFMQLTEMRRAHDEAWILQIEGDTFPIEDNLGSEVRRLLGANDDAWIVGSVNHPVVLEVLSPQLHGHINGAAFYRIDSDEFHMFRRRVWIPSLIEAVSQQPSMAYDCLSAPALQQDLREDLQAGWRASAHRFVRTFGMINASTFATTSLDDERFASPYLDEGLEDEGATVWFLHTKLTEPAKAKPVRRRET